jgi:hypothetical protein
MRYILPKGSGIETVAKVDNRHHRLAFLVCAIEEAVTRPRELCLFRMVGIRFLEERTITNYTGQFTL